MIKKIEFIKTGVIFFFFAMTAFLYGSGSFSISFGSWNLTAPEWGSTIYHVVLTSLIVIAMLVSLFCWIGAFFPGPISRKLLLVTRYRRIVNAYLIFYGMAYFLNYVVSLVNNLVHFASNEILFLSVYGVGLVGMIAIAHAGFGISRHPQPLQQSESNINRIRPKRPDWLLWLLIGLAVLIVIAVILYFFVAKNLSWDAQGYMAFFAAVSASGVWVTGAALALFAYFQWQLWRTQHTLLYIPVVNLISGGTPKFGPIEENQTRYPYRVEWEVLITNSSSIPIFIHNTALKLVPPEGIQGKDMPFSPKDYKLEPANLSSAQVCQITSSSPQRVRWIIHGPDIGKIFDYVSDVSNNREFRLICRVAYSTPQNHTPIPLEITSNQFPVPQNAPWGSSTYVTY